MYDSPGIIFKLKAFLPNDFSKEANFFRCKESNNYVNYINRNKAQDISDSTRSLHDSIVDLTAKLPNKNNINYASNRGGSSGLFDKSGACQKKDSLKIMKNIKDNKGIVWASIISFTPEMASIVCSNKEQAHQLVSNNLKHLFAKTDVDYDNVYWCGAYHTNTDNPHIHLTFFEKQPMKRLSNGKLSHTTKLTFPVNNFNNLKFGILQETKNINYSFMALRDPIRLSLKTNVLNDKFHLKNCIHLAKSIVDEGYFQYARLSDDNKKTIDKLVQYTLKNYPDTLKKYDNYKKELYDTQASFYNLAKENNMLPSKAAINFSSTRMNDLNERLGNSLLSIIKSQAILEGEKKKKLLMVKKIKLPGLNSAYVKKSNALDITIKSVNMLLKSFSEDVEKKIKTQSDESYRLEKKLRGENLIYE